MSEALDPVPVNLGGPPEITGRAVCDREACQWSTAYHGQIEEEGRAIIWEHGSWEETDETRVNRKGAEVPVRVQAVPPKELRCPVCAQGVMRYHPLPQTA